MKKAAGRKSSEAAGEEMKGENLTPDSVSSGVEISTSNSFKCRDEIARRVLGTLKKPGLSLEEERSRRREEQIRKDQEFQQRLKDIEMDSAKRNHNIKDTKKNLEVNMKAESDKKIAQLREERNKSMQLDGAESRELLKKLSETYRTLELNSNATELDEWCPSCGCIHTADVVKH